MAALFAVGVFTGTVDVAANAQGVRVEAAYGRPVMTSMHACYPFGLTQIPVAPPAAARIP